MPEQQLTEEELKNMSPEQLLALQKQNCIFCHIVQGKVSSKKIYEDEHCLAILDINPANPGHILLISKEHYQIMPQVPEDIISHMFKIIKKISHLQLKALKAQGTNIFIANGSVAGQRAPHFMIHIIPRKEGDGLNLTYKEQKISQEDIETVMKKLKPLVNKVFGIAKPEPINLRKSPAKIPQKVVEAEFTEDEDEQPAKSPNKTTKSQKQTQDKSPAKPDLDKIAGLFTK
ncbi:HIT family protein [Candidatus Woesearchaeota archaeon]|nr:HIT family protein [Candidatus Woesearchaeota archaeon]